MLLVSQGVCSCNHTLHIRPSDMDNITSENITVSLVKGYPLCNQILYLVTVKQPVFINRTTCTFVIFIIILRHNLKYDYLTVKIEGVYHVPRANGNIKTLS